MHVFIDWLANFWVSADLGRSFGRGSPRFIAPPARFHGRTSGCLEAGGLPGVFPGASAADSSSRGWRVSLLPQCPHLWGPGFRAQQVQPDGP